MLSLNPRPRPRTATKAKAKAKAKAILLKAKAKAKAKARQSQGQGQGLTSLVLKSIVVTDVVLEYFLEYSTTFIAKYLHGSHVLIGPTRGVIALSGDSRQQAQDAD